MMLTRAVPLVSAYRQSALDKFTTNFTDELVQSYILRHTFDDAVGSFFVVHH